MTGVQTCALPILVSSKYAAIMKLVGKNFLDASTHLYKRVCPSVGQSVGWSVGRSVMCFFFIAENAQTMNNGPTLRP